MTRQHNHVDSNLARSIEVDVHCHYSSGRKFYRKSKWIFDIEGKSRHQGSIQAQIAELSGRCIGGLYRRALVVSPKGGRQTRYELHFQSLERRSQRLVLAKLGQAAHEDGCHK